VHDVLFTAWQAKVDCLGRDFVSLDLSAEIPPLPISEAATHPEDRSNLPESSSEQLYSFDAVSFPGLVIWA
jgi:hypothetical protein